MADDKPVIIRKKKGGHGGHHGGAWKVAYADFVTAMMAFFMVMWLLNSAESKTRQAIASYFRRPGLFESGSGTPLLIGGAGILNDAYAPPRPYEEASQVSGANTTSGANQGREGNNKGPFTSQKSDTEVNADGLVKSDEKHQGVEVKKQLQGGAAELIEKVKALQKKKMEEIAAEVEEAMKEVPEFKELLGLVEVTVNADGLTIEIMDTDTASMFRSGSAQIMPESVPAFQKIASLLKSLPNEIEIMGHTDGKPFLSRGGMSNWELSSDRANTARRLLEQEGIPADRITSVVGRADRELRYPEEPFKPSNRRISLKVKFDLSKLKEQSSVKDEVMKEFSKYFAPPVSTGIEQGGSVDTATPPDTVGTSQVSPSVQAPAKAAAPRVTATPIQGYKPAIEIRGRENKKQGMALPPDDNTPQKNGQSQPTIFQNDPVIGGSPIFGY